MYSCLSSYICKCMFNNGFALAKGFSLCEVLIQMLILNSSSVSGRYLLALSYILEN